MKRRLLFVLTIFCLSQRCCWQACTKPTPVRAYRSPRHRRACCHRSSSRCQPVKDHTFLPCGSHRAYLPSPDKVAQEIQAQLAEIGVEVTLEEMESAAFIDATSAGQKQFYLLGWNADYPDATNFYDYHFGNANNLQFGNLFPDMVEEISAAGKL